MKIGILVFPGITAIDYIGPADLLARIPGATVELVWKTTDPVKSDLGWDLTPTVSFGNSPHFNMIVVPGGPGVGALLDDEETHQYLQDQAQTADWVVGVCTGPLALGAAGLLEGYAATCHWASHELLSYVGAIPKDERVVVDRNRITGAGMTSGLDCALRAIALATDDDTARAIQLFAEYDPQPPFDAGIPRKAPPHLVEAMRTRVKDVVEGRRKLLEERRTAKAD